MTTELVPWWREAVVYQVYLRSFADSDGDGLGDLPGVRSRLPYLRDLGVDALWFTPFYPSPDHDAGYDVTDHRAVDPRLGSLADVDGLIGDAHRLGLKVVFDVVANHTSVEHPWFLAARAAPRGSPARHRYLIRPGRGVRGGHPPNNWTSLFGGSAWEPLGDGDWYLHLFDVHQPDLDIAGPGVLDDVERTLAFWLDRGVDGLRFDAAGSLAKDPALTDADGSPRPGRLHPFSDRPEVHDVYRRWARLLARYPGDRLGVAEVWGPPEVGEPYLRPDELGQAFAMDVLFTPWSAEHLHDVLQGYLSAGTRHGRLPAWVHGNHDVARAATRWGPDGSLAVLMTLLALPGAVYLYAGDELALPEVELPDEALRDPTFVRSGGTERGRDGCRVPLPWTPSAPGCGFGPREASWLPQPDGWGGYAVARQRQEAGSPLETVRRALEVRRWLWRGSGDSVGWLPASPGVLAFRRGRATCVLNLSDGSVPLPSAGGPVHTSTPLTPSGQLPARAAAWLTPDGPSPVGGVGMDRSSSFV